MTGTLKECLMEAWSKLSQEEQSKITFHDFTQKWLNVVLDKGLPDIKKGYSEASVKNEQDRDEFAEKAFTSWCNSYQDLSCLVEYCSDVGERCLASETLTPVEYVLRRGHARACMLAKETLLLLKNAYPDGAMSRWRTLYEISTTMAFVSKHGEECAIKYLDHLEIDTYKAMIARNSCADELGYDPVPQEVLDEQEALRNELIEKYERPFGNDYGWAVGFIASKQKPSIKSIAEEAGFGHWFIHYKTSSQSVHSAHMSFLSPNATGDMGREILLAGQSEKELFNPAQLLAITFTQLTCKVLGSRVDFEYSLDLLALNLLMDSTVKSLHNELVTRRN